MKRSNILISKELDCSKNGLYKNTTLNGRTGYALTKVNNHRRLGTVFNVTRGVKHVSQGIARLGGGTQGAVYLACTSPRCDHNIVIKVSPRDKTTRRQSAEVEYEIQKTLYKIVQHHIPVPYKLIECKGFVPVSDFSNRNTSMFDYKEQFVMYAEYAHGGTLKEWIRKLENRLTDRDLSRMIFQVLSTLRRIYSRYPEFRHNDLHLGNVLVDDTGDFPRLMITDFGLSRLKARGSNPIVNSGNFERVGISSHTSIKYDMHYFLNSFGYEIRHMNFPRTRDFISRMIPKEYLGERTAYVKEYRLRDRAPDSSLPTLNQLLGDSYFNNQKPSAPIEVTSPRVRIRGGEDAAALASSALASMPGVSVSTTTRKPTASEFLRMSPRTREKYKTKTKAEALGESRSKLMSNTVNGKRRATRNTVRRVAGTHEYLTFSKKPRNVLTPMYKTPSPHSLLRTRRVLGTPRTAVKKTKKVVSPRSAPAKFNLKKKKAAVRTPLPPLTEREFRAARNALRKRKPPPTKKKPKPAPAPAPAPAPPASLSNVRIKKILNTYENKPNFTQTQMINHLKRLGLPTNRASSAVGAWKRAWNTSRQNVKVAMQKIKNGKNISRIGFPNTVRRVAQRRVNAQLTSGPNGRVRSRGRLLETRKKKELVDMAHQYGVSITPKMTIKQIAHALFG